MSGPSRTPTLAELIKLGIDRRLASVHTSIPARVERYDSSKQRVDVVPLVMVDYEDEAGEQQKESLPVVTNVPVLFPGAGGYRSTFPVQAGDTGLLVFAEASIDRWLKQGGGPVDPLDFHRFHLSDGVFIPGLRSFADALGSAPTDRATFGKDGGLTVDVTPAAILLGGDAATQAIPNGDLLHTAMSTLTTALSTQLGIVATALGAVAASETVLAATFPPDAGPAATAAADLALAVTAIGTMISALSTFDSGWSGYLSTVGKVKPT